MNQLKIQRKKIKKNEKKRELKIKKKRIKYYSLVIIKSKARAVNSSPKNIKGKIALIIVSGRLYMK